MVPAASDLLFSPSQRELRELGSGVSCCPLLLGLVPWGCSGDPWSPGTGFGWVLRWCPGSSPCHGEMSAELKPAVLGQQLSPASGRRWRGSLERALAVAVRDGLRGRRGRLPRGPSPASHIGVLLRFRHSCEFGVSDQPARPSRPPWCCATASPAPQPLSWHPGSAGTRTRT